MKRCMRCGTETNVTIMSMFNKDIICMTCKDKERKHPDYNKAVEADNAEVRKGVRNFAGIGKPSDL